MAILIFFCCSHKLEYLKNWSSLKESTKLWIFEEGKSRHDYSF